MTKSIGLATFLASPPLGLVGADKFYTESYIFGVIQLLITAIAVFIFFRFNVIKDVKMLIPFGIALLLSLMAFTTLNLYTFADKETLLYPSVEWEKVSTTDRIWAGVSIGVTVIFITLLVVFRDRLVKL